MSGKEIFEEIKKLMEEKNFEKKDIAILAYRTGMSKPKASELQQYFMGLQNTTEIVDAMAIMPPEISYFVFLDVIDQLSANVYERFKAAYQTVLAQLPKNDESSMAPSKSAPSKPSLFKGFTTKAPTVKAPTVVSALTPTDFWEQFKKDTGIDFRKNFEKTLENAELTKFDKDFFETFLSKLKKAFTEKYFPISDDEVIRDNPIFNLFGYFVFITLMSGVYHESDTTQLLRKKADLVAKVGVFTKADYFVKPFKALQYFIEVIEGEFKKQIDDHELWNQVILFLESLYQHHIFIIEDKYKKEEAQNENGFKMWDIQQISSTAVNYKHYPTTDPRDLAFLQHKGLTKLDLVLLHRGLRIQFSQLISYAKEVNLQHDEATVVKIVESATNSQDNSRHPDAMPPEVEKHADTSKQDASLKPVNDDELSQILSVAREKRISLEAQLDILYEHAMKYKFSESTEQELAFIQRAYAAGNSAYLKYHQSIWRGYRSKAHAELSDDISFKLENTKSNHARVKILLELRRQLKADESTHLIIKVDDILNRVCERISLMSEVENARKYKFGN